MFTIFTAPQRASFGSQSILNFRVVAVRDIKLRSHLSKNIYLSHDSQHFQKLEHWEKCLCKCLFVKYRQSVAQIANVSSRCLNYFPAAILAHISCAPTWRFHTELCKFLRNISLSLVSCRFQCSRLHSCHLQSWTKVLGQIYICGAFSHVLNKFIYTCSAPPPPPSYNVGHVYTLFLQSFNTVLGGGGRKQRILKRIRVLF